MVCFGQNTTYFNIEASHRRHLYAPTQNSKPLEHYDKINTMKRNALPGYAFEGQFDSVSETTSNGSRKTTVKPRMKHMRSLKPTKYFGGSPYIMTTDSNPFGLDIMKASAWANVVFLGVLVISVLILLLVYTGSKNNVTKVEDSVVILSRTVERAMNVSNKFARGLGNVNFTKVIERSVSHDENDWVNATHNAKRSLYSIGRLITSADQTDAIKRYSDLANTITSVVTSPKVSMAIEKYSDTAIWAMDWLKSPEASTAVSAVKTSMVRIADTLQSEDTHKMVDTFLNGEPTQEVMESSKEFIDEVTTTLKLFNAIIDQVRKEETIKHTTEVIKQIKEEGILDKLVSAYNVVQEWEGKAEGMMSQWIVMALEWIKNRDTAASR